MPAKKVTQSSSKTAPAMTGKSVAAGKKAAPARPAGVRVKDLMTADVRTCRPADTLGAAAQIMWEADCGCVPVVDEGQRLVGFVTDRDICMNAHTTGRAPRDLPVSGAMARKLYSCKPDDDLGRAVDVMSSYQVRRVPVVDDEGRLVGVLSLNDLVRSTVRPGTSRRPSTEQVVEVLAAISAPPRG
jgi:CBS domain-containing protein